VGTQPAANVLSVDAPTLVNAQTTPAGYCAGVAGCEVLNVELTNFMQGLTDSGINGTLGGTILVKMCLNQHFQTRLISVVHWASNQNFFMSLDASFTDGSGNVLTQLPGGEILWQGTTTNAGLHTFDPAAVCF